MSLLASRSKLNDLLNSFYFLVRTRHFSLVVSLTAETKEGSYLVVAHVSERIIVRVS